MKIVKFLSLGLKTVIILFATIAFAQEEILTWSNAPIGKMFPMGAYQLSYYPSSDIKDQESDLSMFQHKAWGIIPIMKNEESDFEFIGFFDCKNMDTEAIFPATGIKLPDNLYSINIGPSYRRQFANGWTGGALFMVGSASDKLFHSKHEISLRGDLFLKVPTTEKNAWLFFLDYSNRREFLQQIPIPGAAYWYEPSKTFRAIIGAPISAIRYKPFDSLTLEASYFFIRTVSATATYEMNKKLSLYGTFDWNNELYLRAERENNRHRLFYYDKTLSAGLKFKPWQYVTIDISGGYSFDRFFFEAKEYDNRNDNKIDIGNGPFASAKVGIPF
jgi:hypothetical protein